MESHALRQQVKSMKPLRANSVQASNKEAYWGQQQADSAGK